MEKNNNPEILNQKETVRLETFSDGVFCIAVTLLSLEVGVELKGNDSNEGLMHSLIEKWPICLAYVISFINVLLAWIGHHDLFRNLRKTNNAIMVINGLLLMIVALVPFPTKTLGLFLQTPALKTAVVFYTGYFVIISLAFRLLWWAACRRPEILVRELTKERILQINKSENTGLICNIVIMGVAFASPLAALFLSFVMWVYWISIA
jgi:uncharacterized membrane protein